VTRPASIAMTLSLALAASAVGQDAKPRDDTLGARPPEGAYYLFGDDLANWVRQGDRKPATWPIQDGVITVKGGNIMTRGDYRDFALHVEFNVPLMPDQHGQARGNSGVYLQGLYELQVLDSYGLKPQSNDCGAIYQQVIPSVNACKPPLQWQTYDITFRAARVGDGKVVPARLTVVHNGIKTIDDREIRPTPGGVGGVKEGGRGPIMLQDHGNAVQYRNVWIKPLDP
jgi:hypothetical protein